MAPALAKLDRRCQHAFGEDFARSGDATVILPVEIGQDLIRRSCFGVELRNMPFDQQREILFYIVDRLPRLKGGALDGGGNGAYLAEVAAQRYGSSIVEVKFSKGWYEKEMPRYIESFSDQSFLLPADADWLADHQALAWTNGYVKVPDDHRFKGSDGLDRHGDSAIAGALANFASYSETKIYEYTPVSKAESYGYNELFETTPSNTLIPNLKGGLY